MLSCYVGNQYQGYRDNVNLVGGGGCRQQEALRLKPFPVNGHLIFYRNFIPTLYFFDSRTRKCHREYHYATDQRARKRS